MPKQTEVEIPANKNFLGELLVFGMSRRSLWQAFSAVYLRAEAPLPAPPSKLNVPVIYYCNHCSWWDGYTAQVITKQVLGLDAYLMMDVRQLRQYRFFSWAGCFSVNQENGREALASLEYIAKLLPEKPGRVLWLFPQGEIRPQDLRPLGFHSGLARLIRRLGDCYVCPVSQLFEFTREQFPVIYLDLGEYRRFKNGEALPHMQTLTKELEHTLTQRLDCLHDDVNHKRLDKFVPIIRGKGSTDTLVSSLLRLFKK
jgi:1-acyl-sn-glycerol-3-phosphate acyltransferase